MATTQWSGPVPAGLRTAEFALRPIVADDAEKDHAAVRPGNEASIRVCERLGMDDA